MLQVTSHRKVVLVGGRRTANSGSDHRGRDRNRPRLRPLEGLGVFGNDEGFDADRCVIDEGTVSTPTRTVTEPTIPRPARVSGRALPDARARRHGLAGGDPAEGACGARVLGRQARWGLRAGYAVGRREVPGFRGVAAGRCRRAPDARGATARTVEAATLMALRSRDTWTGYAPLDADAARAVPGGRQRHPRGSPTLAELELPLGREREESLPADRVRPVVVDAADGDPRRRHQHRLRATAEHRPQEPSCPMSGSDTSRSACSAASRAPAPLSSSPAPAP